MVSKMHTAPLSTYSRGINIEKETDTQTEKQLSEQVGEISQNSSSSRLVYQIGMSTYLAYLKELNDIVQEIVEKNIVMKL